jgi:hypothetical protein
MASPADLAQVISRTTGVPLPTVTDIDRKLVRGGLRVVGGRGLHATRVAPLDAARLLTALLGSPQANTSAEAVRRYAGAIVDPRKSSEGLFKAAMLDDLAALGPKHSFIDGLSALITSASTGALAKLVADLSRTGEPLIDIGAFSGQTRGRIRISGLASGRTASVEYAALQSSRGPRHQAETGDLEQSRRITGRTIFAIAPLLAQEKKQ